MTSTNDGKDVKSNQNTVTKGKSFYIELYKSLEAGLSKDCDLHERTRNLCEAWRRIHSLCSHSAASTHPHLLSWLQRHTARTVLLTEWQDPENKNEHNRLEEAINAFIAESRSSKDGDPPWQVQLVARGEWFKRILANPWGHPVLRVLLDPKRKESPTNDEVLEWLKEERGVMFVTRLRQLASSKHCNDLALELASSILNRVRACMDPPKDDEATKLEEPKETPNAVKTKFIDTLKAEAGFTVDVIELLTDIEFVLLHKRDNVARCIELAKQTPLRNGYQLVERLQSRQDASPREKKLWKNAKDVATLIAQVVIARCMVVSVCSGVSRTALYCCARSLARLLGSARLATAAAALAAPAATARHLHTLALAVDSESKEDMKPFVCELYVRAITAGMNELERLKLNADKESEARSAEQILSQWFIQLGAVLAASERMRCECTLTAFSVHPSPTMFEKIKAAPNLPPVAVDIEPKDEATTSEFGSWANDSRSQTNLVKTSETLKLKHTQRQANVLSTAILTEGETLHLSPELCQDIAVLLSGPRVKTLSWDMDRQLLLDNCRTYMERTQGGTRALTTELKYLNLDLRQYQHLPEEEEDDSDVYYGIEKGYEHLVEFQEPEEIWEDADRTESAHSSDIEEFIAISKRKSKKNCLHSEDEDPLSTIAEAKRVLKKKERPHSKERSKVPKSKNKPKLQDPIDTNDQHIEQTVKYNIDGTPQADRQIDQSIEKKQVDSNNKSHDVNVKQDKEQTNQKKKNSTEKKKNHSTVKKKDHSAERKKDQSVEKKKEPSQTKKKEKNTDKKKEKKEPKRKAKALTHEQKPSSLSNLIGMKVANMQNNRSTSIKSTITSDNSNDNQVNAALNAALSEETQTDVLFDGLFCMDELKSPESTQDKSERMNVRRPSDSNIGNAAAVPTWEPGKSVGSKVSTPTISRVSTPTVSRTSSASPQPKISDDVKNGITKLIQYRRQKAMSESPEPKYLFPNQNIQTYSNNNSKTQNAQPGNNSKINIDKCQSEKLAALQSELTNLLNNKSFTSRPSICKPSQKVSNTPSTVKILNSSLDRPNIQKPSTSKDFTASPNAFDMLNRQNSNALNDQLVHKAVGGHQNHFQEFLKDLQATINAGTGNEVQLNDEVKLISRVNPVLPNAEPKVTQCAKPPVKNIEVAPNTFSRLSYYKSNQNTIKTKQFVEAIMEHQSQQLAKKRTDAWDRVIAEHREAKLNYLNSSGETIIKPVKPKDNTLKAARKSSSTSRENPTLTELLNSSPNLVKTPFIQNTQKKPPDVRVPTLTKNNEEMTRLLKQQGNQTLNRLKPDLSKQRIPTQTNINIVNNYSTLLNKKDINSKSVILNNPVAVKSTPPGKLSNDVKSGTKPVIIKNEQVCIKNSEKGLQKAKVNNSEVKSTQAKVYTKQQEPLKQTDWESVMDALLKHKTPSRGPNALDMALNKDSYLSAYENSLGNSSIFGMPSEPSSEESKITQSLHKVNTNPSLNCTKILKQSNTDVIKDTKSKSKQSSKSRKQVTSLVLEGHTSSPSLLKHVDQHPKVDRPKTLIAECKQKDTTTIPKKINAELKKQQFTCQLPKEDDPFISGNLNSDYDLLEELIDDDLRQEIGELLSDEECYSAPTTIKDSKSFIDVNKTITPVAKENKSSVQPALVTTSSNNSILKTSQRLPCPIVPKPVINKELTVRHPSEYINIRTVPKHVEQPKAQSIASVQTANQIPNSVIVPPKEQNYVNTQPKAQSIASVQTANQIPNSVIVPPKEQNYVNTAPTVDRTYVAVPQQTALQNVVLIGSELVYQPCIQTPIHTGMAQNNYVTFNTQPNIAVYQTTQFAAPVVNPCIIGNAITTPSGPVGVSAAKTQHSVLANSSRVNAPSMIGRGTKNELKKCDAKALGEAGVDKKFSIKTVTQDNNTTKERYDPAVTIRVSTNKIPHSTLTQTIRYTAPSIIDKVVNHKSKKGDSKDKIVDVNNTIAAKAVPQDDSISVSGIRILSSTIIKPAGVDESASPVITKALKNKFKNCDARQKLIVEVDKKISVTAVIQDNSTKEKDDINICGERKVLSEVQENQTLAKIPDTKNINTQLSFEQDDVTKISNHERLNNKRMAILNRKIYHRSDNSPIALTYAPLKTKKLEITKTQENQRSLRSTVKFPKGSNESNGKESLLNIPIVESVPDEEKDSKENKNRVCRRNSLRSSNKLNCEIAKDSISVKVRPEETKSELESPSTETIKSKECSPVVKRNTTNKKQAVKKNLNKTIKKAIVKKRITRQTSKVSNANSVTEQNHENVNATFGDQKPMHINPTESAGTIDGFMDIEDQIIGSLIPKTVSSEPVFVDVASVDMSERKSNNDIKNMAPDGSNNEVSINSQDNKIFKPLDSQSKENCVSANLKNIGTQLNSREQLPSPQNDIKHTLTREQQTLDKPVTEPEIKEESKDEVTTGTISKSVEKSAVPTTNVTMIKPKNTVESDADLVCLYNGADREKRKGKKGNESVSMDCADTIPQSFLDAIKVEDLQNFDPNDPLKKCVRIKLPNGRAFKATVRGQSLVNIETLFGDPALKKVLLRNISSNNRYTLNIKQISTSNKVEPDKILETRIQKISLQAPKPVANVQQLNCMETINLLSDDDEDDQTLHYFNTEFGKYKVPIMRKDLHEIHQKTFDKKCIIKLKNVTRQQIFASPLSEDTSEPETVTLQQSVASPLSEYTGEPETLTHEQSCAPPSSDDVGKPETVTLQQSIDSPLSDDTGEPETVTVQQSLASPLLDNTGEPETATLQQSVTSPLSNNTREPASATPQQSVVSPLSDNTGEPETVTLQKSVTSPLSDNTGEPATATPQKSVVSPLSYNTGEPATATPQQSVVSPLSDNTGEPETATLQQSVTSPLPDNTGEPATATPQQSVVSPLSDNTGEPETATLQQSVTSPLPDNTGEPATATPQQSVVSPLSDDTGEPETATRQQSVASPLSDNTGEPATATPQQSVVSPLSDDTGEPETATLQQSVASPLSDNTGEPATATPQQSVVSPLSDDTGEPETATLQQSVASPLSDKTGDPATATPQQSVVSPLSDNTEETETATLQQSVASLLSDDTGEPETVTIQQTVASPLSDDTGEPEMVTLQESCASPSADDIGELEMAIRLQSVASPLSDDTEDPETEVILSKVTNADTIPIPIALTKVISQVCEEESNLNEESLNQEIIEIDDSSDDELYLNNKNNDARTCEEKIQEFKNLLLKDLGVEEVDDNVSTSTTTPQEKTQQLTGPEYITESDEEKFEELIVPDTVTVRSRMSDKSCCITLTNCDDLVEKYKSLKLIKKCYINLVRCDDIHHDDSSSIACSENSYEELEMISSPSLLRSESLSILNDFDQFDQLVPTDNFVRNTSPVMAAYEILAALRISKTESQPEICDEWKCESEWFLTKPLIRLQNKSANNNKIWQSKNVNENVSCNIDDDFNSSTQMNTAVCKVPSLFTIVIKFFQEFGISDKRRYIHTAKPFLKPSYNLKRKSLCSVTTDDRISKRSKSIPSASAFANVEKFEDHKVIFNNELKHLDLEISAKKTELTNIELYCDSIMAEDNIAKDTSNAINIELVVEDKPSNSSEEVPQIKTTEVVNVAEDLIAHEEIMDEDPNGASEISKISASHQSLDDVPNETEVPSFDVTEENKSNGRDEGTVSENATIPPVLQCDVDAAITTDLVTKAKCLEETKLSNETVMSNTSELRCNIDDVVNTDIDVINGELSDDIELRNMAVTTKASDSTFVLHSSELSGNTTLTSVPKTIISHIDITLREDLQSICTETPGVQKNNTENSIQQKHEISNTCVSTMLHEPNSNVTLQALQNNDVTGMLSNEDDKYLKSIRKMSLETEKSNTLQDNSNKNNSVRTSNCDIQTEDELKIIEVEDIKYQGDMGDLKIIENISVITSQLISHETDSSQIKPCDENNQVDLIQTSPNVLTTAVDEKEKITSSVSTETKLAEINSLNEASDEVISDVDTKQVLESDINIKDDILINNSSTLGLICRSNNENASNYDASMTEVSDKLTLTNVSVESCTLNDNIEDTIKKSDEAKPCVDIASENCNDELPQNSVVDNTHTHSYTIQEEAVPTVLVQSKFQESLDETRKPTKKNLKPNSSSLINTENTENNSDELVVDGHEQIKSKNQEPSCELKDDVHKNKSILTPLSEHSSIEKVNDGENQSDRDKQFEEKLVQINLGSNNYDNTSKTTRNDLLNILDETTVTNNKITEHDSNEMQSSISLSSSLNTSSFTNNDNKINIDSIILGERCAFLNDSGNDLVEDIVELQGNDELEQELARIVLGGSNGEDDKQILIINADNLEFDEVKVCCIQQSELQKLIQMENNELSDQNDVDYDSPSKEPNNLLLDDDDFSQSSEDILQITQEIDEYGNVKEIDIRLNVPKVTYSRKDVNNSFHYQTLFSDKKSKRGLKRKGDMADAKAPEKKYRKGKNIDTPKLTAITIAETAYSKEFKRLFDYCSTVKFSYSRPFHKDYIDVHEMLRCWPVAEVCNSITDSAIDVNLFIDAENGNVAHRDPMNQTLAEEIKTKYSETDYCFCPVMETNFQMGFGERSGRVIQNLEDSDEKFSAATLSDVKQSQPLLLSENFSNCDSTIDINNIDTVKHEIESLQRTYKCIQLKDKIRSFFKNTMVELNNDWIKQNKNYDVDSYEHKFGKSGFPFGLNHPDFISPPSVELITQVVQVGQLPVSTAAQNPVTCDPRVTQVSDASPSQCTPENSSNDDSQSPKKTEYTELTTANISLPLQEYAQHHSQLHEETQNSTNIIMHDFVIEEIKEEIKEEEETEVGEETNENYHVTRSNNEFSPSLNCIIDNVDYAYEGASPTQPITRTAEEANSEMVYNSTKIHQKPDTDQQYHEMQLHNNLTAENHLHLQHQQDDVTQHASDNAAHFLQQQDQSLIMPQSPQTQIANQSQQQNTSENLSEQNHKACIQPHSFAGQLQIQQQNVTSQVDQQQNQHVQIVQSQETHIVQHINQTQIIQQHLQAYVAQQNNETQVAQHSQQTHVVQQNQQVQIMQQNIQQMQEGQLQQNQQILQQQQTSSQQTVLSHVTQVQLSQQHTQMTLPQHSNQETTRAPEKIDQIAHAMNAAGISTSSESLGNTRAHALVNILSQKLRQGSAGSSPTNSHPKTTQINAMSLQQALAQILPPALNQTNGDNQSNSNNTPQVLHIVQGKNASGNQITLIDNSQSSVINTPNATPVLHIVQNKGNVSGPTSNSTSAPQTNSFSGLSLVDAGLQQGNQLLHIVNTGNQKNTSTGQLLRKVNLLTNLTNVQGSNEQKMVQFVCKSADGKSIQLNSPHPRGMVLRLQPVESPNIQLTQTKPMESQELSSPSSTPNNIQNKEAGASQQEIKSRSIYEENYAKFIQSSNKTVPEKSTSLPKFGQAFGKQVFQEGSQKADVNNSSTHIQSGSENPDCQPNDNAMEPPLLLRKSPQTSQAQPNLVQQLKQTMAPVNMSMHGGVIYTRQIPVNIGGGQTINLITVPSTDLIDDSAPKQSVSQEGIEPSIIKIVPQTSASNAETSEETNAHIGNDNSHTPQSQPVLTQMRIKLPMLSKSPQVVGGARLMRPSFFQIQRNVIGGANQPVYQQLVLTAAPPLGQQTIRLPQTQTNRPAKAPSESQSSSESQMSSSTLEQLREFDLVLEQVKERSTGTVTSQPNASSSPSSSFSKVHTSSTDTTDSGPSATSSTASSITQQVLYSICNNKQLNVAYVNKKTTTTTATTSSYVRSPDSSGIVETPTSSSHIRRTISSDSSTTDTPTSHSSQSSQSSHSNQNSHQAKSSRVRPRPRPKASSNPPNTLKLPTAPPKTSTQKPAEDEQTTQRILYILAEYKEQVENSPDKDKPAPRRRTNLPCMPGGSKRKKSSSGSRRSGRDDMSPCHGEDTSRTMGSEDSSCGTSQGDCNESCVDSHSPQDSPRKVVRKLTFEQETAVPVTQPRPQPSRNVIVADGQTITVARGATGKPTTAVLMPANYILPVSMVKGGQQIAIVTNRGPKLLTVGGGEGGATNALLLQRLIGPTGLKPVLTRPGVRHVRLPTAALHNLQAFNLATATTAQPPDSTVSPAPVPTPDLVDTRATSSPWRTERESREGKPDRGSSPEGSEPWNLPSSDYSYEETVRAEQMDRTVLDPIPDRYSPDMEAQRIFDKMFDVDSKKSYMVDSHDDSPRCGYDIDASDCDDKVYHQVVHKKDGSSHRQHRLTHVSAAALRHKYAILEHELRLQKSLSEECEDLGVDSPSASELFPEAELLFAASPAHDHTQDMAHHSHTPQPMAHTSIPQPDLDDQIATDHLLRDHTHDDRDLGLGLEDVGIVTVSEDGMQATIQLDQEEFARSHPNTTFHSEPTEEGEVQHSFTLSSLKSRHITSTILHSNRPQGTVLMTAPQTTVISQATPETSGVHHNTIKYSDIDNMINCLPSTHTNNMNLNSVFVKDDGLSRFDSLLQDSREIHLSNATPAIRHSSAHATQVIRRVYDDKRERDHRFLIDEPEGLIAGDDANMRGEDSSRDATLESMGDTTGSSPERHADLFWDSASARVDYSSDSEKCCKSPLDDTSIDSSPGVGVRAHVRLDSVIKEARGHISDDDVPPLRTYPAPRSLSGKTAPSGSSDNGRRRASGRGVVKRGSCLCCVGDAPSKPKKPRVRRPALDFATAT